MIIDAQALIHRHKSPALVEQRHPIKNPRDYLLDSVLDRIVVEKDERIRLWVCILQRIHVRLLTKSENLVWIDKVLSIYIPQHRCLVPKERF